MTKNKKILVIVAVFILVTWGIISYLIGCNIRPGLEIGMRTSAKCTCIGVVIKDNPRKEIQDMPSIDRCIGLMISRSESSLTY